MITEVSIIKVIQQHVDLPEDVLAKLGRELYTQLAPYLPKINPESTNPDKKTGLTIRDWEELLVAIQKLKEIHSTIEPRYLEDTLYVDQLKQLEFKVSEILFKYK